MTEDQIQAEAVELVNNSHCLEHHNPRFVLFSVPNGGFRNKIEAVKMKATGLKKGVSDLILLTPNKATFIEYKDAKGTQKPEQLQFEKQVKSLGFDYFLFRTPKELLDYANTIRNNL